MNAMYRQTTLLCVPLLLVACAGSAGLTKSSSPAVTPQAIHDASITTDEQYVAEVERIAKRRGVDVVWVNPPSRHLNKTASR